MTVFSIHMIFGPFYFHLEFGTHRQIISHSFQKAEMLSVRKSGGESSLCLGLTCGSPEPGAVAVYDGVKGSGLEVEHLDVGPGLADGECQNIDILIEKDWPGHNNWTRQYKKQRNWRVGGMMTYEERVAVFNVLCWTLSDLTASSNPFLSIVSPYTM